MTAISSENSRGAAVLSVETPGSGRPVVTAEGNAHVDQPAPRPWFSRPWLAVLGTALGALGLLLLVISYVEVSHESMVALQLPYVVSGGLGGLFALGTGAAVVLARELRLDNERLCDLDRKVSMLGEAVEDVLDDLARLTERLEPQSGQAPSNTRPSDWA